MIAALLSLMLAQSGVPAPYATVAEPAELEAQPTTADLEQAYPADARARRVSGLGRVTCRIRADRTVGDCVVFGQEAKEFGFDEAVAALAPKFRLTRSAALKRKFRGEGVGLVIRFAPPAATGPVTPIEAPLRPERPRADLPSFYPMRALEREVQGAATLTCRIDSETHRLRGCVVLDEKPPAMGFGGAAVLMAESLFRMGPTTEDLQPTADGTVRVPIRFGLPD